MKGPGQKSKISSNPGWANATGGSEVDVVFGPINTGMSRAERVPYREFL